MDKNSEIINIEKLESPVQERDSEYDETPYQ
jgi:hypothetical protein